MCVIISIIKIVSITNCFQVIIIWKLKKKKKKNWAKAIGLPKLRNLETASLSRFFYFTKARRKLSFKVNISFTMYRNPYYSGHILTFVDVDSFYLSFFFGVIDKKHRICEKPSFIGNNFFRTLSRVLNGVRL